MANLDDTAALAPSGDDWETVRSMVTVQEAVLIVQRLAAVGIRAHVPGLEHRQLVGDLFGAAIHLDVKVPSESALLARQILSDDAATDTSQQNDEDDDDALTPVEDDLTLAARRNRMVAFCLAFIIPFGGAHAHLRASRSTKILALLSGASWLALFFGNGKAALAIAALIAFDILGSQFRITQARRRCAQRSALPANDPYRTRSSTATR